MKFRKPVLPILAAAAAILALTTPALAPAHAQSSPIQHIIVLDLENHSFDNLLGFWCQGNPRCGPGDAMPASVTLSDGAVVTPSTDPDVVPVVNHSVRSQVLAMDGGRMDGWQRIPGGGCAASTGYQCISGYQASQVPNITALAGSYAMNDRFFSLADSPSWGGHLYAVAGTTDGFTGNNPAPAPGVTPGPGWGCDSGKIATRLDGTRAPSCIPDWNLGLPNGGASGPTDVLYVPTIMDRLDAAGLTWKIYGAAQPGGGTYSGNGYIWSTCPSIAECLRTSQDANLVDESQFFTDAQNGTLPSWSLITAGGASIGATDSCHNGFSMTACDDYVGQVASAVENSPEWSSTALLITWDDFGGFYDSVPPPVAPDGRQEGPRQPLIAVSPYAVPASTDSTDSSMASVLAFTEHNFGLPPLERNDAEAYPLTGMFDLSATPHLGNRPRMVTRQVPEGDKIVWSQGAEDS